LMKERARLQKRIHELSQKDYLINLKRDLRTTEEEIKQQTKLKQKFQGEQQRHDRALD